MFSLLLTIPNPTLERSNSFCCKRRDEYDHTCVPTDAIIIADSSTKCKGMDKIRTANKLHITPEMIFSLLLTNRSIEVVYQPCRRTLGPLASWSGIVCEARQMELCERDVQLAANDAQS